MAADNSTLNTQIVNASPDVAYRAFVDAHELLAWLPPGEMTGQISEVDARVGGGYRLTLRYPDGATGKRGKSSAKEDIVDLRFVALEPPYGLVQTATFVTDEPGFTGAMRMTATFTRIPEGTHIALLFQNIPPAIRPEDNLEGAALSLTQLARHLGGRLQSTKPGHVS